MDGGYHQLSFADMLSGKNDKPYVQKITRDDAKPFIMGIHYARRMPSITHAFGLFEGGGTDRCCNIRYSRFTGSL